MFDPARRRGRVLRLEALEARDCPAAFDPRNFLLASGDTLREYTFAGKLVQEFHVPDVNPDWTEARDVVVGPTGEAYVFNGVFHPLLSTLDPDAGTWTHRNYPGWNIANSLYLGGNVTAFGPYVFANDEFTYNGGEPKGLIRFDTRDGTTVRFDGDYEYIDVNVGLDGKLYGLLDWFGNVRVFDPSTLDLLRDVQLQGANGDLYAIAIDAAGDIYGAAGQQVRRYGPDGVLQATLDVTAGRLGATGINGLTDIDVSRAGRVLVGGTSGKVLLADTLFADATVLPFDPISYSNSTWVSFADYVLDGPTTPDRPAAGSRQTAGVGFWRSTKGKRLILSLNGGPASTRLGGWLAATFPNLYGASAGAKNLAGKTNAQVAAFFASLSRGLPWRPPVMQLEARVLAAALSAYVTREDLGGTAARRYGFVVDAGGLGVRTVNVGRDGAVFGVPNGSDVRVIDLLRAVNARSWRGLAFDLDRDGDATGRQEILSRLAAFRRFAFVNRR